MRASAGECCRCGALAKNKDARKKQVRALCEAWGVHRRGSALKDRPFAKVIDEFQQAVFQKGTQLRAISFGGQTGVSAAQPGAPTRRQRCIVCYAMAAQSGPSSACSSFAAPPVAPGAINAPSSVEQTAHAFISIRALNSWLNAQGDASSSTELQRLRSAVEAL